MKKTLLDLLLERVEKYSYPENPKAKNREKKQKIKHPYIHVSVLYFPIKDEKTSVVTIKTISKTYRRMEKKPDSKRDIHRKKGN